MKMYMFDMLSNRWSQQEINEFYLQKVYVEFPTVASIRNYMMKNKRGKIDRTYKKNLKNNLSRNNSQNTTQEVTFMTEGLKDYLSKASNEMQEVFKNPELASFILQQARDKVSSEIQQQVEDQKIEFKPLEKPKENLEEQIQPTNEETEKQLQLITEQIRKLEKEITDFEVYDDEDEMKESQMMCQLKKLKDIQKGMLIALDHNQEQIPLQDEKYCSRKDMDIQVESKESAGCNTGSSHEELANPSTKVMDENDSKCGVTDDETIINDSEAETVKNVESDHPVIQQILKDPNLKSMWNSNLAEDGKGKNYERNQKRKKREKMKKERSQFDQIIVDYGYDEIVRDQWEIAQGLRAQLYVLDDDDQAEYYSNDYVMKVKDLEVTMSKLMKRVKELQESTACR
jgi:hypothetical protein